MKIRMAKSISFQILLFFCHWPHQSILSLTLQANREGIIKTIGKSLPDHPSYSQIRRRRVNKLDISTKSTDHDHDHDDDIVIALYSIGIKVTNRGPQWMQQEKWHIKKKKKKKKKKKGYQNPHC